MKFKHCFVSMLALAAAVVSCEEPKEPVKPVEPALEVTPFVLSVAETADEATFQITTNQAWTAESDQTWATLDLTSGEASEEAVTVKVTVAENPDEAERTAKITVKAAELTKTVTLTQAAKVVLENGTQEKPWLIKTAADLVAMRDKATPGATTYFKMEADVDMTGVTDFVPVNYGDTEGEGDAAVTTFTRKVVFDGNNKTISNFSCTYESYPSLFGVLYGTVKNLTVTGAKITAKTPSGIIAGYAGTVQNDVPMPAVLENVVVSGELTANSDKCGGLAGVGYNVTVTNCSSDVKINASSLDNGGLFGQLQGENVLTACNTKSIIVNTVSGNARTGSLIGWNRAVKTTVTNCHVLEGSSVTIENVSSNISGFIAFADNANMNTELTVTNCSSKANVNTIVDPSNGSTNVSAFIGSVGYTGSKVNIVDCFAEGDLVVSGNYSGGIVGKIANNNENAPEVTITGCHYSGTQSGRAGAGGLVGGVEGGSVSISKSYASGTLTINTSGNQGGLLGLLNASATATIENCWSDHALTIPSGSQHAGGIIGCANGKAVIKNTFAKGDIKGSRGLGGIVGHVKGADGEISGCIAWNSKIEGDRDATKWACGAIIGAAHSQGVGTYKNCWRRADMVLVDVAMKLTDHEDVINARPPFPDYAPADVTQNAYHGKAAAAGATLSSVAKAAGWDETVWDLSKDVPVLK